MIQVYKMAAFCGNHSDGNLAGVCILDGQATMSRSVMQAVAAKLNYSETAFVTPLENKQFHISYFTPNDEVDLCGHATIASFTKLYELNIIEAGSYIAVTKAGKLNITVTAESVFMEQLLPIIYNDKVDRKEIAESLNTTPDIFHDELPLTIISTGLKDIFIPIKRIEQLQAIKPNYEWITSISQKLNIIGYHLFTIVEDQHYIASCRNFAPVVSIPEENATGTSSGALASYLFTHGIRPHNLRYYFQQGSSAVGTGYIEASIQANGDKIIALQVGGTARFIDKIELEIS